MREINDELRGLLKNPNRSPSQRKNRVVFDETRNEFFEADYIILIREDCAYDEEEEPCTCGEHEIVQLCCEEGCQCNFSISTSEDSPAKMGPEYSASIEFIDEAALSPPDGYKDIALNNTKDRAFTGHIFGSQHFQQLQVIQRLQHQKAAMLAVRSGKLPPTSPPVPNKSNEQIQDHFIKYKEDSFEEENRGICTECTECAECSAKKLQDVECKSLRCLEPLTSAEVPSVAMLPLNTCSPERRTTQKEIVAGEERPKYILQVPDFTSTVAERRRVWESPKDNADRSMTAPINETTPTLQLNGKSHQSQSEENIQLPAPSTGLFPLRICGILKGGKLWKQELITQPDDDRTIFSEEHGDSIKRSVHFEAQENQYEPAEETRTIASTMDDAESKFYGLIPIKKHSTLFNNMLRPNSAVRQLFPGMPYALPVLTSESLRKLHTSEGFVVPQTTGDNDAEIVKRSVERNILRRSLNKKKSSQPDDSLEERIKRLTCYVDEIANEESGENDHVTGQECPINSPNEKRPFNRSSDKNISPNSSISSSSRSSSALKKQSDMLKKENQKPEMIALDDSPLVIVPAECRCPAAPDLGIGMQVPVVHTQIHQISSRLNESKRPFLSTLAPLTACVVGNKDDMSSYYTLASQNSAEFSDWNSAEIQMNLNENADKSRAIAPDVLAGTPGKEDHDDLSTLNRKIANRKDKIRKHIPNDASNVSSEDDERNDYGFNKRPSVRGVESQINIANEILQQIQEQLLEPATQNNKTHSFPRHFPIETPIPISTSLQYVPRISSIIAKEHQDQKNFISGSTVAQQKSENRCWSFFKTDGIEQQGLPLEGTFQSYFQTLPTGAMFRKTMIQQGKDESIIYAQNCQRITAIGKQHIGRCARTRRPESPPPLRNYHQTMVFIPCNAKLENVSKTVIDQTGSHKEHENVLEYQQMTQQMIRIPFGFSLPGMQMHVAVGPDQQSAQYVYAQSPNQRTYSQRSQLEPNSNFNGISPATNDFENTCGDQNHNSEPVLLQSQQHLKEFHAKQ